MAALSDGDYRDFIEERQKKVSSQRSQEAADKLWEKSTEKLDRERNRNYLGEKAKQKERERLNQQTLQRQSDFSGIPGMGIIKKVIERKKSLKKKTPSPPSSGPLLPPPPPSTGMADEGQNVYDVLEQISRHKDKQGTPQKKKTELNNTRRMSNETINDMVDLVNTNSIPKGKSSRGKSSRGKPRRNKSRRWGRRKTQRRRGGRRKSRRRRGKNKSIKYYLKKSTIKTY